MYVTCWWWSVLGGPSPVLINDVLYELKGPSFTAHEKDGGLISEFNGSILCAVHRTPWTNSWSAWEMPSLALYGKAFVLIDHAQIPSLEWNFQRSLKLATFLRRSVSSSIVYGVVAFVVVYTLCSNFNILPKYHHVMWNLRVLDDYTTTRLTA